MTRTEQDKILSGIIAGMLLGLGLLLSCCSSPTGPAPAPLKPGDTLSSLINGSAVTWALSDSTYRFEQHTPPFGLVSWERGTWWIGSGWDDAESVWFARSEGAVLADSRSDTWAALAAFSRPYAVIRSRDSVGLRSSSGAVIFYQVEPRDR